MDPRIWNNVPQDTDVHVSRQDYTVISSTSNYAIQSQILFSTYFKVHVYHIMELFIYAFKFQFIVKI